jgi:pyruvate dehydrogenase E1 component beta subunit
LTPLDKETILSSVRKTGKLIVTHQAATTLGVGAEILAIVAEEGIPAKVKRVASEDTPIPYAKPLEDRVIPDKDKIVKAALALIG